MKKIYSFCKIIFINFIIIVILLLICDLTVFKIAENNIPEGKNYRKFKYLINNPDVFCSRWENYFTGKGNYTGNSGRLPDGLEYKDKKAIIIFGCSYAYGYGLNPEQTFSKKLSNLLNRPVYNRAITGGSLQHMYLQTMSDKFYRDVPDFNTVFYVMIPDHFRRILDETTEITDDFFYPYFFYKNGNLIYEKYSNPIRNFFLSSYSFRLLRIKYKEIFYLKNRKKSDELTNLSLAYFLQSRNEMEKHLKHKINFYVILYDFQNSNHKQILTKKLLNNNFIVIDTQDIINSGVLYSPKYFSNETKHPTEDAWNLLTPSIIKLSKINKTI